MTVTTGAVRIRVVRGDPLYVKFFEFFSAGRLRDIQRVVGLSSRMSTTKRSQGTSAKCSTPVYEILMKISRVCGAAEKRGYVFSRRENRSFVRQIERR